MVRSIITATLVALGFLVTSAGPAVAGVGPPRIAIDQRHFDHDKHTEIASKARDPKRRTTTCSSCHQLDGTGVPKPQHEHKRCAKCHNPNVRKCQKRNPMLMSVCVVCHQFNACSPSGMIRQPDADSYEIPFPHQKHVSFGVAIEKNCALCHTNQAPEGAAPANMTTGHGSCSSCHKVGGSTNLVMTGCQGCHAKPKPAQVAANNDPFRLTTFDHRRHHAVATAGQAPCATCHTAAKIQSGASEFPRPEMKMCATACHNGQRAFNAVGTKCTKCHQSGSTATQPNNTEVSFSHTAHSKRGINLGNCTACHAEKDDGNLLPHGSGKDHQPCAQSGCHQQEFWSKTPKICGVCHDASMPWQKADARLRDSPKPEFFENMNHESHLKRKGETNAACADCHGDKLGGGKRPGGHDACSQCHGKGGGAFAMTECGRCHSQTKPAGAETSEWSVREKFVHEIHARDPRSKKVTRCTSCHAGVKKASTLAEIRKPTMAGCGTCHDGKVAFKTTGYECSRCHTKPSQPSTPAAAMRFTRGDVMAQLAPWDLVR